MKRTIISVLVLVAVFAAGFLSVDTTEARPICITQMVEWHCCVAVGWAEVLYCCVAPDGTYISCEIRVIRDKTGCPVGCQIC